MTFAASALHTNNEHFCYIPSLTLHTCRQSRTKSGFWSASWLIPIFSFTVRDSSTLCTADLAFRTNKITINSSVVSEKLLINVQVNILQVITSVVKIGSESVLKII